MKNIILLQRAMVVNRMFSAAMIQRHAGLSKTFVYNKMKDYAEQGLIKRAGLGSNQEKLWRLTQEGKRRFDPNVPKEPMIKPGLNLNLPEAGKFMGRHRTEPIKAGNAPERRLWKVILEIKVFTLADIVTKEIANKTTVQQYVTALTRAGFLSASKNYPCVYSLVNITGEKAPLMGRALYLYDPNTNRIWDDIPISRKVLDEIKNNSLEDARTPCQALLRKEQKC